MKACGETGPKLSSAQWGYYSQLSWKIVKCFVRVNLKIPHKKDRMFWVVAIKFQPAGLHMNLVALCVHNSSAFHTSVNRLKIHFGFVVWLQVKEMFRCFFNAHRSFLIEVTLIIISKPCLSVFAAFLTIYRQWYTTFTSQHLKSLTL